MIQLVFLPKANELFLHFILSDIEKDSDTHVFYTCTCWKTNQFMQTYCNHSFTDGIVLTNFNCFSNPTINSYSDIMLHNQNIRNKLLIDLSNTLKKFKNQIITEYNKDTKLSDKTLAILTVSLQSHIEKTIAVLDVQTN